MKAVGYNSQPFVRSAASAPDVSVIHHLVWVPGQGAYGGQDRSVTTPAAPAARYPDPPAQESGTAATAAGPGPSYQIPP